MRVNTPILFLVAVVKAQDYDYQDYADGQVQDVLYQDYAVRQQEKNEGSRGGGFGYAQLAMASAASWVLGAKIHSARVEKTLKKKHSKERKELYNQYYNDVVKLEGQKLEQQALIDQLQRSIQDTNVKHEMEDLQREYDEFKQPDVDGDDRISRAEFNNYVKDYLSNYPGLTGKDYPKFENFDHDKDGYVSFEEYAKQMAVEARQAELEQLEAQHRGKAGMEEMQLVNALYDLYGSAAGSDGFKDLYAQIR